MQPPESGNVIRTPPNRLILVGASVRAAAQSAARAGFCVTGIDCFGDTDTMAACEHHLSLGESTLRQVLELHPDAGTPVMVVGGLASGFGLIGELEQHYQSVGTMGLEDHAARRPEMLQRVAEAAAVRFPEFHRQSSDHFRHSGRWLVKDSNSSGGLAVHWASQTPGSSHSGLYFQRWVPGRPVGATFLSDGSTTRLLGICRGRFTRIGRRPFVYAGSCGPLKLDRDMTKAITGLGAVLVSQCGLRGIFNVDLMIDDRDLRLLEVNGRWSASCELIERAMSDAGTLAPNESLLAMAVQACGVEKTGAGDWSAKFPGGRLPATCGQPLSPAPYLKRIVFSCRTGRFDRNRIAGLHDLEAELADVPQQQRRIHKGDPILSVILKYPDEQEGGWKSIRRLLRGVRESVV